MTANLRVAAQLPQRLQAHSVDRLVVADTDIFDSLQLAKIADRDHAEFSRILVGTLHLRTSPVWDYSRKDGWAYGRRQQWWWHQSCWDENGT